MSQYDVLLREATIAKLRAKRLADIGDDAEQWQAVVDFHVAARKEIEALRCLDEVPPETEAGARIEACGLLLDGRDPVSATEQWLRIPSEIACSAQGEAMLARLRPIFEAEHAQFIAAWQSLSAGSFRGVDVPRLQALADRYSGVVGLWWALACKAYANADTAALGNAIQRVRALDHDGRLRVTTMGFAVPTPRDPARITLDPERVDDGWGPIDDASRADISRSSQPSRLAKVANRLQRYNSTNIPRRSLAAAPLFRQVA